MRVLFSLLCVGCVANAYQAHDLVSDVHFSEASLLRMRRTMARLNSIQKQIFSGEKSDTSEDEEFSGIQFDQEFSGKPDELPYLFEGDILLTDEQMDQVVANAEDQLWAARGKAHPRRKRSMTSDLYRRWKFPIPYYIYPSRNERGILAGIKKWEEETCVTFTRKSTPNYRENGLNFVYGSGCYSYIGVSFSGPQQVSIGARCDGLGTVTHEIGHALGFHHEQSRYDRDNYVRVMTQNIQSGEYSQFTKEKKSSMTDYGVGYDFGSVMHYGPEGFAIIPGYNTMESRDKNYQYTFGQRIGPAFSDIKRINLAYCNSTCTTQLDCLNGGYTDPKNCAKCRCPDGFGGILCDRAADANAACGANELVATNQFQTISARGAINCPYIITAPPGRKVYFELSNLQFTRSYFACDGDYVEIKYHENVVSAGARFCKSYPKINLSEGNRLVVIYKGSSYSKFALKYRQDPISPEEPATPPPTTTQKPSTVVSTTAEPEVTTFFPSSSTTLSPNSCSEWTQCTARCGGCGTTTRRCDGKLQTRYCNTDPCDGGYCCRPFFYVKQGLCVRPYQDELLIAEAQKENKQ